MMHSYLPSYQQMTIYPKFCSVLLMLFLFSSLSAQERELPAYYDGPYIFQQTDSLHIKWVERGYPQDTTIARSTATMFRRDSLPEVNLQQLAFPTSKSSTYMGVPRVVAISDVHGQYELMRELLLVSGVIDTANNWKLGAGHLVVNGDNFDRGDEVLPILWLLFELEQQALAQGGRLHLLLGNHELMVLHGDLRYIHRKYTYTAGVLQTPYHLLFAKGSVLGDWIAQHQVAVSVNETLFVHAGLSPEVVDLDLSLDELNAIFREKILRQPDDTIAANPLRALLYGGKGPLWYRGYFEEEPLSKGKFKRQLKQYNQSTMVVGHTSQDDIHTLYGERLIVIDCSIKLGLRGQVLLIEGDAFSIIDQDGEQLPLKVSNKKISANIQQTILSSSTRPQLTLRTDWQQLMSDKMEEVYQPAEVSLRTDKVDYTLTGRVRARGNVRKAACVFPPLMVDLRKSDLDSLEYIRHDKLKLVIPCHSRDVNQVSIYKEFLAYELYRLVNDHGLQTQLVDIEIIDPKRSYELTGFLIETEHDYGHRTGAQVIQTGRVVASVLDRQTFVRMLLFQYMIANCDWSLSNQHNLELVKYPDKPRTEVIAYDFDYAGFVGNSYAVPAPELPISSVHERYFFPYEIEEAEINVAIDYFLGKEAEIYAAIAAADYLDETNRERCAQYLEPFFKLLRNPMKFKRRIGL
jgi:hypothetical protein